MNFVKSTSFYGGLFFSILIFIIMQQNGYPYEQNTTAAITLLCAIWWVFEPIPIPATSLIPMAAFPLMNILSQNQVAAAYGNKMILLLMGGLILSSAMEKSGVHKRIAIGIIKAIGIDSPKKVIFGFMIASALLSMWISNTATTLMLLPIGAAVLGSYQKDSEKLAIPLFLGIAYAASIGGIGTLIGTPPNQVVADYIQKNMTEEISFITWMKWGLPIVIILLPIAALWLTRNIKEKQTAILPLVGPWQSEEKRVLIVFSLTALAWVTRTVPFGGWETFFGALDNDFKLAHASDASVALIAVVIMFIIPNGKGEKLLSWEKAESLPWGVLLLFAGGITIAKAFETSKLSVTVGSTLQPFVQYHPFVIILAICLLVTFLTEVTSNTATVNILTPILGATATQSGLDPMLLLIPAAASASCAFMLPVATAPNAIIFSTGKIKTTDMAREGLILNFIGAIIISVICYFIL